MTDKKKIKLELEELSVIKQDLVGAAEHYACKFSDSKYGFDKMRNAFIVGAHWQEENIKNLLLSQVLPCFMNTSGSDGVVRKLDEILNG